jgi:hypothetical protein
MSLRPANAMTCDGARVKQYRAKIASIGSVDCNRF